ncbi:virulence protein MsgA [Salmonella enterica subsp. enterica serovar Livingstone]|nr:virulence protein MsgA [Salmonella enterica]EDH8285479.1 virulence protein MsgA [Salmonella enterica subsp. enterica serovar Livingstone]ECR7820661.1 virulence protein MsgA [Salmonella enterica]EDP8776726.1 virulence protein MsgA [Salmonella enterica subsp. enterica serovar Livingstone]EED7481280.1 virulence protein MsgA [Salmonella enterica subsp. enterica serovar Livingstone]
MPAIKKLADARDVILHELIGVSHVCTKTEKAHLYPMLEEMFAVAGK